MATVRPSPSVSFLTVPQVNQNPFTREPQVGNLQRDQLRAPERAGEAYQQKRLVPVLSATLASRPIIASSCSFSSVFSRFCGCRNVRRFP